MSTKQLAIHRFDPETKSLIKKEYLLPSLPGATLLQALQYIYEELDSSLAFRYGCRYKRCGLCGVMADGLPRLACKTKLEDVYEVSPLVNLPLLRGLAVDRTAYFYTLQGLNAYPQGIDTEPLGTLHEDPLHKNLTHCVECLCCVSSCPEITSCPEIISDETKFAGPFPFIKLAQMHLDPRDGAERKLQARMWGIGRCRECGQCKCPNGIKLQHAIRILLNS